MTATPSLPPNAQFVYNTTDWGFILSNINNSDAGNYSFSVRAYDLINGSADFATVNITLNITENKSPTVNGPADRIIYAYQDV